MSMMDVKILNLNDNCITKTSEDNVSNGTSVDKEEV